MRRRESEREKGQEAALARWPKVSILANKRFLSSTEVDDPFRIRAARSDEERSDVCPSGIVLGGGAGRKGLQRPVVGLCWFYKRAEARAHALEGG
jgi:hypothetical protein